MQLAVIIVNYRSTALTIECLLTLQSELREGLDLVYVIDNYSEDNSLQALRDFVACQTYNNLVTLLEAPRNGGFAYGNNLAIRSVLDCHPEIDIIWFLNPDTLIKEGAVRVLVNFLERTPEAAIVGTRLLNANGLSDGSARRMVTPFSELLSGARLGLLDRFFINSVVPMPESDAAYRCDWVSGASMTVRRHVLEDIGLLDEGYFLYFEELDFCFRATQSGWQVWYLPGAEVVHLEGAITGIKTVGKRRPEYWFASRCRFFVKHYGVPGVLLADLFFTIGRLSLLLRSFVFRQGKVENDPRWLLRDILLHDLRALPSLFACKRALTSE